MASRDGKTRHITPEVLLRAYACGIFPMAESADDPGFFWVEPEERGIIPLGGLQISSRLARTVRSNRYRVTVNQRFSDVIGLCAQETPERDNTWINDRIRELYTALHHMGHCHSVEVWENDTLVGGLYGVSLGGAFFGESMFHRARDASKVALIHLVARLTAGGFVLLDTQYVTDHLRSLGAIAVLRSQYHDMLDTALQQEADFMTLPATLDGAKAIEIIAAAKAG
jgi:leucyl/phenylalanyl-tRNA--protein transferase